jgi:hypothetical protein
MAFVNFHGILILFECIFLQQAAGNNQVKLAIDNVQGLGSAIISSGGTNCRL